MNEVFSLVEAHYTSTTRSEAKYLWDKHVQLVAQFAAELSKTYQGNAKLAVAGALLHDVADVWLERDDPQFAERCTTTTTELLTQAGYAPAEVQVVLHDVIAPHSCYPNNLPKVLEGKILATADAMAHLTTTFYEDALDEFFQQKKTRNEHQQWVCQKLERDFHQKIFFAEIKAQMKPYYEKLTSSFHCSAL